MLTSFSNFFANPALFSFTYINIPLLSQSLCVKSCQESTIITKHHLWLLYCIFTMFCSCRYQTTKNLSSIRQQRW